MFLVFRIRGQSYIKFFRTVDFSTANLEKTYDFSNIVLKKLAISAIFKIFKRIIYQIV